MHFLPNIWRAGVKFWKDLLACLSLEWNSFGIRSLLQWEPYRSRHTMFKNQIMLLQEWVGGQIHQLFQRKPQLLDYFMGKTALGACFLKYISLFI